MTEEPHNKKTVITRVEFNCHTTYLTLLNRVLMHFVKKVCWCSVVPCRLSTVIVGQVISKTQYQTMYLLQYVFRENGYRSDKKQVKECFLCIIEISLWKYKRLTSLHSGLHTEYHMSIDAKCCANWLSPQIAKSMGPPWGPPGSCQPQMSSILAS